jgi:hypothetical protein
VSVVPRLAAPPWAWSSGRHDALGFDFGVRSTDARLGAAVGAALGGLAAPGEPARWYSLVDGGGAWEVWLDGTREAALGTAEQVADFLFWHLNQEAVGAARAAGRVVLHAAAVAAGGRAVVVPGPPDSGKTTLTAALVRAGFGYLTDEAVVFDEASLAVAPFPKPLVLGPAVAPDLADLCPPATRLGSQWRVPPGAVGSLAEPAAPGLVVAPSFSPGEPARLEPLTPAEAVVVLGGHSFNLLDRPQAALDLLARVARQAPCYRLAGGDLREAVRLVREVFG